LLKFKSSRILKEKSWFMGICLRIKKKSNSLWKDSKKDSKSAKRQKNKQEKNIEAPFVFSKSFDLTILSVSIIFQKLFIKNNSY
jgi:hypothetical protein